MSSNEDRKRTVEEAAADLYGAGSIIEGYKGDDVAEEQQQLQLHHISKVAKTMAGVATTPKSTISTPRTPPNTADSSSSNKAYKGLRHFSMMVCKKVEEKGTTSYNEVADELVLAVIAERRREQLNQQQQPTLSASGIAGTNVGTNANATANLTTTTTPTIKFDEKNIRRRVYDALNVLMAMDIIYKNKKEISWKGLPTTAAQDLEMLHRELGFRQAEVERKREALQELLLQQVCFRNLVEHNQTRALQQQQNESAAVAAAAAAAGADAAAGAMADAAAAAAAAVVAKDNKIPLPFIVVNTSSSAVIQCNMSRDLTDVMFDFSMPFEINDDNTILKRLGLYVRRVLLLLWLLLLLCVF